MLNDVLSKIFKEFLSHKNTLFGGEGFLFIDDCNTKTVSETVLVEFTEELQVCKLFIFIIILN